MIAILAQELIRFDFYNAVIQKMHIKLQTEYTQIRKEQSALDLQGFLRNICPDT